MLRSTKLQNIGSRLIRNSGSFNYSVMFKQSLSVKISPLLMPSLSPTMTQGTIASWKKNPGDVLNPGDILCEIETDKASVGFEVQDEGVLAKILVPAQGPEMKVGEPIAFLVEDSQGYQEFLQLKEADLMKYISGSTGNTPSSSPAPTTAPIAATSTPTTPLKLSPAARHIVESNNYNVHGLVGTARGGRISKSDVIQAVKAGIVNTVPSVTTTTTTTTTGVTTSAPSAFTSSAPISTPTTAAVTSSAIPTFSTPASSVPVYTPPTTPINDNYTDIPNNNMRKIIAKRLTESKATVPHFYTSIECEIDNLLKLRKQLKKEYDINISVNDLVIKSAAHALRDLPRTNSKWDKTIQQVNETDNNKVDISIAVATPNGLITPIVTSADRLGASEIGNKVKDLASRAREGKLKPEEFQGGSFSISNLGMFGIGSFSAVINPPQACILAVGAGITRVLPPRTPTRTPTSAAAVAEIVGEKLKPRIATIMTVQLSGDRRVVTEAQAAQFLQIFQQYLSEPQNLLL